MTARRFVFKLHLYTGLLVGLLLVLSGLSGSVLVFREEIEAFAYPELLVTTAQGERVAVDEVLQTVQRAYPEDRPFAIRIPRTPQQTYLVKMNSAHDLFVYVDPYSGRILGAHRQKDSATGWVSLLHTELLSGKAGETALGIGGLLLIGLCATGLVIWWPRNGKISQGFKVQWSRSLEKAEFRSASCIGRLRGAVSFDHGVDWRRVRVQRDRDRPRRCRNSKPAAACATAFRPAAGWDAAAFARCAVAAGRSHPARGYHYLNQFPPDTAGALGGAQKTPARIPSQREEFHLFRSIYGQGFTGGKQRDGSSGHAHL